MLSQQEHDWLPTLVQAYAYFEPLFMEKHEQEIHLLRRLTPEQFDLYHKRSSLSQTVGKKFIELIAYNFLVGERQQTEAQFGEIMELLGKWLKQRYGCNLPTVFDMFAKVFHYQRDWMMKGVREDLEGLLTVLSSDSFRVDKELNTTGNWTEGIQESEEVLSNYSDLEPESVKKQNSSQETHLTNEQKEGVLTKMRSYIEKPKDQQNSTGLNISVEEQQAGKDRSGKMKVPPSNTILENLEKRPLVTLKAQVNEYLESIHQYKAELAEFCHQLGFADPTYSRPEKKAEGFSVHCKMDFTSEHTRYQPRIYQTVEMGATAKLAEQAAARKVLSMLYIKHEDMWQRFVQIKSTKNLKIE